ncbi:MAG: hypothetical protein ACQSGP_01355 [Frankia sp.]
MRCEPDDLYGLIQFGGATLGPTQPRNVRRVIGPFPNAAAATRYAADAGLRDVAVVPLSIAVPPNPGGWPTVPAPRRATP